MRSRSRSLLAKVGLLSASLVVALLLAEAAVRLLGREKVALHGLFADDPVVGVTLTPGFSGSMRTSEFEYRVAINDLGMRDGSVAAKPPGVSRVLVIGDSFVHGVGVDLEDSLPKALERRLAAALGPGRPVEAYNGGVPGYSPFQELHLLRRLAPAVEPDLVVLVFFTGDDFTGNAPRVPPSRARRGLRTRLSIHSSLFRAFDRFVLARLKGRERYDLHRLEPTAEFAARRREVIDLLAEVRAAAANHGAPLLVVLCPRYTQVYDSAWAKAALVYRLGEDEYSPLEPNRGFGALLEAEGFWTVDLLEPLRREGGERRLHFPVDGHWNREGNEFVAGVLAAAIAPRLARAHPVELGDQRPQVGEAVEVQALELEARAETGLDAEHQLDERDRIE